MRVTMGSQMMFTRSSIGNSYSQLVELQERVATGKMLVRPSDNPVLASRTLDLSQQIHNMSQFVSNAGMARDFMARTSVALDGVHGQVNELITLAQESINSTMGPEARTALATQIESIGRQMEDLARTQHLGRYIFSGQRTDVPPLGIVHTLSGPGAFAPQGAAGTLSINGVSVDVLAGDTADALAARINAAGIPGGVTASADAGGALSLTVMTGSVKPSTEVSASGGYTLADIFGGVPQDKVQEGFTYAGDNAAIKMQVSPHSVIDVSVSAAQVFNLDGAADASAPDLFEVARSLRAAIESGNVPETEAQMANLEAARERLLSQRVSMGGRIRNLEGGVSHLEMTQANLKELKSMTEDADIAQAVVDLKTQEQVYQASLFSASSMFRLSLMDYLR